MTDTISILGCGAGGMAMAADLTLAGHRVHLYELPEFASNVHEDVPYAFVPFVSIARQLGVAVPVTAALVDLCGTAFGSDYWAEGPDAARLGLAGLDAAGIRRLIERE